MEIQIQHLESPITAFDQKEPLVGSGGSEKKNPDQKKIKTLGS